MTAEVSTLAEALTVANGAAAAVFRGHVRPMNYVIWERFPFLALQAGSVEPAVCS